MSVTADAPLLPLCVATGPDDTVLLLDQFKVELKIKRFPSSPADIQKTDGLGFLALT